MKAGVALDSAMSPGTFIRDHIWSLFFRQTRPANGSIAEFTHERDFWARAAGLSLSGVKLRGFRIVDWFPRAPGVFWSQEGVGARWADYKRPTTEHVDLGSIYRPDAKTSMVERGGLGTLRLKPRRLDGHDYWLATAVAGTHCAGGIPVAIPNERANSRSLWGKTVDIDGQVRFITESLDCESRQSLAWRRLARRRPGARLNGSASGDRDGNDDRSPRAKEHPFRAVAAEHHRHSARVGDRAARGGQPADRGGDPHGRLDALWNDRFRECVRAAILGESVHGPFFGDTVREAIDCRRRSRWTRADLSVEAKIYTLQ